jgi:hypothetical protein
MISSMHRLASLMQFALLAAFVLALGGAFLPGSVGHFSGVTCIFLLIVTPVVRVAWLTTSWARSGDRRFALLGGGLLVVLAVGAVTAFLK